MKSVAALAVVMVFGMLLGALITWRVGHNPRDYDRRDPNGVRDFLLGNLSSELNLSEDQQQKISNILKVRIQELRAIHKQIEPQQNQLRTEVQQDIRSQLTPDQQAKFQKLLNEYSRKLLFIAGPPPLNR